MIVQIKRVYGNEAVGGILIIKCITISKMAKSELRVTNIVVDLPVEILKSLRK